jgi:hypothetical protein
MLNPEDEQLPITTALTAAPLLPPKDDLDQTSSPSTTANSAIFVE